jgi:hypothetical protein
MRNHIPQNPRSHLRRPNSTRDDALDPSPVSPRFAPAIGERRISGDRARPSGLRSLKNSAYSRAQFLSLAARIGTALAAIVILLAPALWNRFPLLEYDTGGYLARWFEGYLVPSRSTVYGLFLVAGWPLDFWPVVFFQAAATVWILALVFRTHGLGERPFIFLPVIALLSATTALSWNASMLLTDIFAGLAVLALHLLVLKPDQLERWERIAMVGFVAFATATHSATFLMLLGLAVVALLVSFIDRTRVPRFAAARAAVAIALGAVTLLTANYVVARRIVWTPGGYGIVFGRMLEDGIVARYLEEHCPDPRFKLCSFRRELPATADEFLWGEESVFNDLGRFDGLGDEMRAIVLESLVAYPLTQVKTAFAAAAKQLIKVKTGEGVIVEIWHTYGMIDMYVPSVLPAMRAARQQHGDLHFEAINAVHVPIALAGTALLPFLILLGLWRRSDADLGLLAATAALAIVMNAFVCGPLSNAHDRYGARIAWLAPFVIALVPLRRFSLAASVRPQFAR